ncbi:MAG TPA: FemAB family XrtA/PEP-CTERM system-associated protein [Nitrospira sp.]|nr:FemAB family XrtA/PEP-CTERM system-associated protein [Nitrospira sp.]
MSALTASLLSRSEPDSLAWDSYVLRSSQTTGYHLSGWRRVIEEAFGHQTYYLLVKEEGTIQGLVPLVLLSSPVFGRFLVSLPFVNYGGLIADSRKARSLLESSAVEQAQTLKATHIELRHEEAIDTSWVSSERKVSMRLRLPASYDALVKTFPSKLRSQVRRAQKEGMLAQVGGREFLDAFYAVFSRCMRDLGTPVYSKQFFAKILEIFPKEARICVVSHGHAPVAAGFLYGFRSSIEIPWAASDKRYNRLAPNMLLYGSVLEHACQQGFQVFDFGRSTPDSGTYRFKAQWGAQPKQLHWYYWMHHGQSLPGLNPQNPKYALAIRMWQRLPLAVANLLGPHIVKHLP